MIKDLTATLGFSTLIFSTAGLAYYPLVLIVLLLVIIHRLS